MWNLLTWCSNVHNTLSWGRVYDIFVISKNWSHYCLQLGVALGFLVPLIVPSIASANTTQTLESESPDIAEVLYDGNFALLFYIKTGVTGALFLAVLIGKWEWLLNPGKIVTSIENLIHLDKLTLNYTVHNYFRKCFRAFFFISRVVFKNKPKHPPNPAQAAILPEKNSTSYLEWIKILGKDLNFLGLVFTFGQMVGAFFAIGTLLNQIVLYYFEASQNFIFICMYMCRAEFRSDFYHALLLCVCT